MTRLAVSWPMAEMGTHPEYRKGGSRNPRPTGACASALSRDPHVRIRGSVGEQFPEATRHFECLSERPDVDGMLFALPVGGRAQDVIASKLSRAVGDSELGCAHLNRRTIVGAASGIHSGKKYR